MSETVEVKVKRGRGRPKKDVKYMEQTKTIAIRVRRVVLERFLLAYEQNKAAAAEKGSALFVNGIIQDFMEKYSKDEAL